MSFTDPIYERYYNRRRTDVMPLDDFHDNTWRRMPEPHTASSANHANAELLDIYEKHGLSHALQATRTKLIATDAGEMPLGAYQYAADEQRYDDRLRALWGGR